MAEVCPTRGWIDKDDRVASSALTAWRTDGLERLRELESVHVLATGHGPGRRWGTQQLNRSLFVALMAQFQAYCRDLHDQAVAVNVAAAAPGHQVLLQTLLTQGRKLDVGNPRKGALGSDFGKFGFAFIADLQAEGADTSRRLDMLEDLVDFRNAVGHGDEAKIDELEATTAIRSTKLSYTRHRQALNALAGTMDRVVAQKLVALLGGNRPW